MPLAFSNIMNSNVWSNLEDISYDAQRATKVFSDIVFTSIWPLVINIHKKLQEAQKSEVPSLKGIKDVFTLSCSQIKKCILGLFDVFKIEHHQNVLLQNSRQCSVQRLSWCLTRLGSINQVLDQIDSSMDNQDLSEYNNSLLATPMYFVNWIDHTFEILAKLSTVTYRTDHNENEEVYEAWKTDIVETIRELHTCLDELLLSTMTLCKYCLPCDQHIVKARCQVVLRETKVLLSELITGDLNGAFKVTKESLKLPINPSNVNVLIDVLKDVLYVLETNTNTALLALLVHCFSSSISPVDLLNRHFSEGPKGTCPCEEKGVETEDCLLIKEFDLYNERLLHIGTFAVSCSSDQNRILSLRSGLASLEALDPHLVPAIMLAPQSHHARLMTNSWKSEVKEIRDSVFLIVDPAAFAEKSKQMMHQTLAKVMEGNRYDSAAVCAAINIGCVLQEFFVVYQTCESDALLSFEKLPPLLLDLKKVRDECKIVSNLLCTGKDFMYDIKIRTHKEASFEQLLKRLKLLYTIVNRINTVFHPLDDDDQLFVNEVYEPSLKQRNITHTILRTNGTYVCSPLKVAQMSRSIFGRTHTRTESYDGRARLSKQFKAKRGDELSFSVQLDILLDSSSMDLKRETEEHKPREAASEQLEIREPSILYKCSPKKHRSSLRKAVLRKNYGVCVEPPILASDKFEQSLSEHSAVMDESTSLQITEILDQMTDISHMFFDKPTSSSIVYQNQNQKESPTRKKNVLTLDINQSTNIAKHIWKIPVNASTVEMCLDDSASTHAPNISNSSSQPSNVSTLERLNDLDFVESRLNNLKLLQQETIL